MQTESLEIAVEAFNQWRKTRKNSKEAIPSKLWDLAIGLYPRYKQSQICKGLHLCGGQFKKRLHAYSNDGFTLAKMVPPNTLKQSLGAKESTLTLQGKNRALSLRLSIFDLPEVLPHFEKML